MNDIKTQVITIASVESKTTAGGVMTKLKDQTGQAYTFFDKKRDGSPTKAQEQFNALGAPQTNKTVEVGYKERAYQAKDGSRQVGRNIVFLSRVAPPGEIQIPEGAIEI